MIYPLLPIVKRKILTHSGGPLTVTRRTTQSPVSKPRASAPAAKAPTPRKSQAGQARQAVRDLSSDQAVGLTPLPNPQDPVLRSKEAKAKEAQQARQDIELARQGKHPKQAEREEYYEAREANTTRQARQDVETAEKEAKKQKEEAQSDFDAATTQGEKDLKRAKSRVRSATREQDRAATRIKNSINRELGEGKGPEAVKQLDAYLELRQQAGDKPDSQTREDLQKRAQALSALGIDVSSIDKKKNKPRQHNYAVDYAKHKANRKESEAKVKSLEASLEQLGVKKDRIGAAADDRVAQARQNLKQKEAEASAETVKQREIDNKNLIADLEQKLEKAQQFNSSEVDPAVRNSSAYVSGKGHIKEDGSLEIRDYNNKPTGNVRTQEDGSIVVTSDKPDRQATSTLTPNKEGGYTESGTIENYHTNYGEGGSTRGGHKHTYEYDKNAAGDTVHYKITTPKYDGSRQVAEMNKVEGGEVHTYSTYDKDGKRTDFSKTTDVTTNGVREERTVGADDGKNSERKKITYPDGRVETTSFRNTAEGKYSTDKTEMPDGSSVEVTESSRAGYDSRKTETVSKDGKKSELDVTVYKGKNGSRRRVEQETVDGKLVRETQTESVKPNKDLPGLGWIGSHNPQQLLEQLGKNGSLDGLTAEKTTVKVRGQDGQWTTKETLTISSADGKTQLVQSEGANGGKVWELRRDKTAQVGEKVTPASERDPLAPSSEDGRIWDTQKFFQGTEDTVITKNSKEDGFLVARSTSSTKEMAKDSGNQVPSGGNSTVHSSEKATQAQLNKMLSSHTMGAVTKSDSFQAFAKETGGGPYKVVASEANTTLDGKTSKAASLTIQGPNGQKLLATYDPATDSYAVRNESPDSNGQNQSSLIKGNDRLELGKDGTVTSWKGDTREWVEQPDDNVAAARDAAKKLRSAGEVVKGVGRMITRGKSKDAEKLAEAAAKNGSTTWGKTLKAASGGFLALSATSIALDLQNGKTGEAMRKGGELGIDIGSMTRKLSSTKSVANWARTGGKFLGAAGVLTGGVFAAMDFADEKWVRGGLGVVSTAGGLYALAGASGPLGWGLAGVGLVGQMAWDYNDGTKLAKREI